MRARDNWTDLFLACYECSRKILRMNGMPAKAKVKLVPVDDPERKGRRATRDARKQQLIEATIDSLAKRGYAETTMADISEGAGLSRGIVNFHFESKENLLIATLQWMADEYVAHWSAAYHKAGPRIADKLWALVAADFDKKICNRRKIAAWGAFWGKPSLARRTKRCAVIGIRNIQNSL